MLPDIKKILYATGLGAGAPYVFRYALSLARKYAAEIEIIHVQEPLSPFAQNLVELHIDHTRSEQQHAEARAKIKGQIEQRLNRLCENEQCQTDDGRNLVTAILVEEGQPAESILQIARQREVDIIVLGSQRHTVLGETLVGSTANKVLHKTNMPVLLVRIPDGYHEEGF